MTTNLFLKETTDWGDVSDKMNHSYELNSTKSKIISMKSSDGKITRFKGKCLSFDTRRRTFVKVTAW